MNPTSQPAEERLSRQRNGKTAIIVVSCDRYADLWEPFFKCFFKYWADCPYEVYLGTNHKSFDCPSVTSLPIGEDRSYSENLSAMLALIPEEWVIFWVDDRFISGPVVTAEVIRLIERGQKLDVAFLKLIPEHPLAYHDHNHGLGPIPKGTKYRVSMTIALWRKTCLNQLLVFGETAWALEKNGTNRSVVFERPFYGLSKSLIDRPPIPHVHTLVKGRIIRSALKFLQRENLNQYFRARKRETAVSVIYSWIFCLSLRFTAPVIDRIARTRNLRTGANA